MSSIERISITLSHQTPNFLMCTLNFFMKVENKIHWTGGKEHMKEINKITYIFVKLSRHLPGIYQKVQKC
jgi:hypothetical protein